MPSGPARTADDIAQSLNAMVDRMVDAKFTREMTSRGREIAELIAERGTDAGDRAAEAWRDSAGTRKRARKALERAGGDAAQWSESTWRRQLRPALRDLWKRRSVAVGAAGAAVPVGRELVDEARVRLGMRRREERRWGVFFLGLLIGAAAGAIVGMLMAPKPGSQMRRELGNRANELGSRAGEELSTRAREDWKPLFQRATGNGPAEIEETADRATDAAERAGDEAAEAINEAFESGEPERDQQQS